MGVEEDQISLAGSLGQVVLESGDNLSLNSSITYLEYLYQGGDAAKSSKDKKASFQLYLPWRHKNVINS